jgi:hypothetical protein
MALGETKDYLSIWKCCLTGEKANMPLPALAGWEVTAQSLHKVARLLGAIRQYALQPLPNYLHLALKVEPFALSTDILPDNHRRASLDFEEAALRIYNSDTILRSLPLNAQTLSGLFEQILADLQMPGLTGTERLTEQFFSASRLRGQDMTYLQALLDETTPLVVDLELSWDYGQALNAVFTGMARFRAHLTGLMTPVAVWPHHFDLSFLWFATAEADENVSHVNFGFAPFSEGFDEPYLYAYAYPMPQLSQLPPLPEAAHWNTQGWTGVVLPYKFIADAPNPEMFVEIQCEQIFRTLRPLLA